MNELKAIQILKALLKAETDEQCVSVNGISVNDALQELEEKLIKETKETIDLWWRCCHK